MTFKRTKSRCSACPLRDNQRVWSQGGKNGFIFIGEAPGRVEESTGEPFVGPAGRRLDWGLGKAGIPRGKSWLMNRISCRPPNNKISSEEGQYALQCCEPGFREELNYVRQFAKVIVPLGNVPSHALGIDGGIYTTRGSVYSREGVPVVPTLHPSGLLRGRFSRDKADSSSKTDYNIIFVADLKKARRLHEKGYTPLGEHFNTSPSVDDIYRLHTYVADNHPLLAIDIETTALRYDSGKIVLIGIAWSQSDGISIPLLGAYGRPYWAEHLNEVKTLIDEILSQSPLVFQNAKFDVSWLRYHGFNVPWQNIQHDTLLLSHALHSELPRNLEFISSLYGSTPAWKAPFKNRATTILDSDQDMVRTYNLRDCVVLHQVIPEMLEDAKELHVETVYREESLPLIEVIATMEKNGILIDKKALATWKKDLETKISETEETLRRTGQLPIGFNLDSGDDIRWFIFREPSSKLRALDAHIKRYDSNPKLSKSTKVYKEKVTIPLKLKALKPLYEGTCVQGTRKTDSGKLSFDESGRISLRQRLTQRLSALGPRTEVERPRITALMEWINTYDEYKRLFKLASTYTQFPIGHDGRVHPEFLQTGTATRRLSCDHPNLQNQPLDVRHVFVPQPGWSFLSVDYSNFEIWILAFETRDPGLIDLVQSGGNIHDANTQAWFHIDSNSPHWKTFRDAAKVIQFGGIQYGGGPREIHRQVTLRAPEANLTLSDIKTIQAEFRARYTGYAEWEAQKRREAHETRIARTALGGIRQLTGHAHEIEKQNLNTPIQMAAAQIMNRAMIRIHREIEPLKSMMILQIHDELLFEVPAGEEKAIEHIATEEMQKPIDFYGTPVKFPIETKWATNWKDCK